MTPPQAMADLRALCDRRGLVLHLDGARLFNAAVALDVTPAELAPGADSVAFCVSKALGAPVGSLLAGSHEFVTRARRMRKMLGGTMRQAGVLAAAGLVALDGWRERLAADHRRARVLAERLAQLPGLNVEPEAVETNIVLCDTADGVDARALCERLLERGLACSASSQSRFRLVLHHQIGDAEADRLVSSLRELL